MRLPYPSDVLRLDGRPLVQFPLATLEATMANPRAIGVALRDRVSGRIVGYALGSALENHDEEGVGADPHYGDNNTFFLQALATQPAVRNTVELENHLLESVRERAVCRRVRVPLDADRGSRASRTARRGSPAQPCSNGSKTTCAPASTSSTFRRRSQISGAAALTAIADEAGGSLAGNESIRCIETRSGRLCKIGKAVTFVS